MANIVYLVSTHIIVALKQQSMIFFLKSSSDNIIAFGQPTILSYLLIHEGQERGQFKNSMIYAANIIT